jgi:hypothetical protein
LKLRQLWCGQDGGHSDKRRCAVRTEGFHVFSGPYKFDGFLFFARDLVLLYYLYKTRGARGIPLWFGVVSAIILPVVVSAYFHIAHLAR